ncbi:hypothetical protein BGX26_009536 [Mortierella sp. AD094]|nr:hypothetical protein BGX26_009536 [Mortierella sp. AD094]
MNRKSLYISDLTAASPPPPKVLAPSHAYLTRSKRPCSSVSTYDLPQDLTSDVTLDSSSFFEVNIGDTSPNIQSYPPDPVAQGAISAALESLESPLAGTRKEKGSRKRLNRALAERQSRHGVHPGRDSNENGKHQLSPSLNHEDTKKIKKSRITGPEADQPIDKRNLPFDDEEDDSRRINKKSKQYPESSPSGSNSRYGNSREHTDIPTSGVSSPTTPIPQASQTTVHLTLVDTPTSVSASDEPSLIDTAEAPAATDTKAQRKARKGKEAVVSIISKLGSRRKHNTNQRPLTTEESSIAEPNKESGGSTKKVPLLRRTESALYLESKDDETGNNAISHNSSPSERAHIPCPISPDSSSPTDMLCGELSKPAPRPLSELKLYVVPKNMDSGVFEATRKRVICLGGSWLGPRAKTLTADPRAKPGVPKLDQENTTHIVSALKTIDEVMLHLNVGYINSKISVVSREWLSDTIMHKTPMEVQGYALQQSESTITLVVLDKSPSPNRGCTKDALVQQSPDHLTEINISESNNPVIFNGAAKGMQEGPLGDPDFLIIEDNNLMTSDIEGTRHNIERHTPEPRKNADPDRLSDDIQLEPRLDTKNKITGLRFYDGLSLHTQHTEAEDIGAIIKRTPATVYPETRPDRGNVDDISTYPNTDNENTLEYVGFDYPDPHEREC